MMEVQFLLFLAPFIYSYQIFPLLNNPSMMSILSKTIKVAVKGKRTIGYAVVVVVGMSLILGYLYVFS